MTLSIRMHGGELDGYVFTDVDHARRWLAKGSVQDATLELVEVSEFTRCRHCGGEGFTRRVKRIRRLTVSELLSGANS